MGDRWGWWEVAAMLGLAAAIGYGVAVGRVEVMSTLLDDCNGWRVEETEAVTLCDKRLTQALGWVAEDCPEEPSDGE